MTVRRHMRRFSRYVQTLKTIVRAALADPSAFQASDVVFAALDGQPGRELRHLVSVEDRRTAGAFFTGSRLANVITRDQFTNVLPGITCDPACGAGDLLVAASQHLPVSNDLRTTLEMWAAQLRGYDIHREFIEATRLRLILAAIRRGVTVRHPPKEDKLMSIFTDITTADGLTARLDDVHTILMNPPYGGRAAPPDCPWATGNVSAAAVFMTSIANRVEPSTKIIAILPDVLRTGSRYAKWREQVQRQLLIHLVKPIGLFDAWTDVDVFVMYAKRTSVHSNVAPTWWPEHVANARVADFFDVHVGAVVPHRDPKRGPWRRFIHARLVPPWQHYDVHQAPARRFDRRTFDPPFVVIRRTSRPDDASRAIGTIVTGDDPVAVENHLLVALPRDSSLRACRRLLKVLQADSTTDWLNTRIRCRHLTVSSVANIPWSAL